MHLFFIAFLAKQDASQSMKQNKIFFMLTGGPSPVPFSFICEKIIWKPENSAWSENTETLADL